MLRLHECVNGDRHDDLFWRNEVRRHGFVDNGVLQKQIDAVILMRNARVGIEGSRSRSPVQKMKSPETNWLGCNSTWSNRHELRSNIR